MYYFCQVRSRFFINKKNVEQVGHSLHDLKALASPEMSKRATLKAPRRCIKSPSCEYQTYTEGVDNTPHWGAPVALFLTFLR